MPLLFIVVLAVVQGITEFLPVSSSGHLELSWRALDRAEVALPPEEQRLILFVAVHLGSLLAVMLYFWRDIWAMLRGVFRMFIGRGGPDLKLLAMVIVASLPLVAVGFLVRGDLLETVYSLQVIGWATIGFAILLFIGDRFGLTVRRTEHITLTDALFIGLAQVLALLPGTSRSGVTMTAARFLGFERGEAARFSLLLSMPAILGASTLSGYDLYQSGNLRLGFDAAMAAGLAFVSAWLSIALMMAWLRSAGFTPFVVYRLAIGVIILWLAYQNGAVAGAG